MWLALSLALAAEPPTWLVGCWASPTYQEVWLGRDGLMVGASVAASEKGPSWEHLWLGPENGVLTYVASPSGQARTAFPLVEQTPTLLRFESPAHDFPQRIVYRRTEAGLDVRVESLAGEGFSLALAPCTPATTP